MNSEIKNFLNCGKNPGGVLAIRIGLEVGLGGSVLKKERKL